MNLKTQNSEAKRGSALIMCVRVFKQVQWKQICVQIYLNKGKGKVHLCTALTAQKGSRGIALLFLDHDIRSG